MNHRPLWISLLLACAALQSPTFGEDVKPDMVFLLIGQSNMAGRAPLIEEDKAVIPRVYLLNDKNRWEPAANPLNRYASNRKVLSMQRMGPGDGFVRRLTEAFPDRTIGLIVNARGGSSIEQWAKGRELYDNTLARVRGAGPIRLAGVLWHQGESNAQDADYLDKLVVLVKNLRSDLDAPALPFVAGAVAKDDPVNKHLSRLPETLDHTAFASAEGLSVFDGVHFDRASQKTFGARYADAYMRLAAPDKKPDK